ncbi:hypothetical protein [Dactylosporangium sp. NPDC051484]|uniref:hypothetical protein n=1 Tax=Dactylosporangium sp. NPDC051484 TaxID=3154942 RepID=UPI00344D4868
MIAFPELLATFRAAAKADAAAGWVGGVTPAMRATETARSNALEQLVHAVECPQCGATTADCTGKVTYEAPLWSLDHELPMHQARIDAVNRLARETDGGPKVITG